MKHICIGILASLLTVTSASAGGWATVHKYVKRSGSCAGQEVLASMYSSGKRTANGERFDMNGNTAAARTWPLGTSLTVTNPQNGRSLVVRINDTGPWGIAYRMGARLDLARGRGSTTWNARLAIRLCCVSFAVPAAQYDWAGKENCILPDLKRLPRRRPAESVAGGSMFIASRCQGSGTSSFGKLVIDSGSATRRPWTDTPIF